MPHAPETRESLIQRLPDAADAEAWDVFVQIYEPLLFRLARGRGLQTADAEDFVQEVLTAVTRNIERWLDDADRGSFRDWLFRIASNLAINFLTRPKHVRWGAADSRIDRLLDELPEASGTSSFFLQEYRRELFRWAADRTRQQVTERQWLAFWQTSIEELPIPDVAKRLEMSVGSVYIARSRISKRIRELVRAHEEQTQ